MKKRTRSRRCVCAAVLALVCVAGAIPSADEIAVLCNITASIPLACDDCTLGCGVFCGTTQISFCDSTNSTIVGLNLDNVQLTELPESIGSLQQMTFLFSYGNQLAALPESIWSLQHLVALGFDRIQLTVLPEGLVNLQQLTHLGFSFTRITALPESIGSLQNLTGLNLSNNNITALPASIGSLQQLSFLGMSNNNITALPESIGSLQNLTGLVIDNNKISGLSESIGSLKHLHSLDFNNNELSALPESIANLNALEILALNNNKLTALPESIGDLQKLNHLEMINNQLTALPESIGNLTDLNYVILYGNCLNCSELDFAPDAIRSACIQSMQIGTCPEPEISSSDDGSSESSCVDTEEEISSNSETKSEQQGNDGSSSDDGGGSGGRENEGISSTEGVGSGGNTLLIVLAIAIPVALLAASAILGVWFLRRQKHQNGSDDGSIMVKIPDARTSKEVSPTTSAAVVVSPAPQSSAIRFVSGAGEGVAFMGNLAFGSGIAPPSNAVLASEAFLLSRIPLLREILSECEQAFVLISSSSVTKELVNQFRLTPDEVFALVLYTFDIGTKGKPSENFFFQLNDILRNRSQEGLDAIQGFMWFAMGALRKLPDLEGIVFRGNNSPDIVAREYKMGREIFWSGFTSTTADLSVACNFAGSSGVVFRVEVSCGKVISAFSAVKAENEVLLLPNTCLTVTKTIHTEADGMQYVDLIEKTGEFRW